MMRIGNLVYVLLSGLILTQSCHTKHLNTTHIASTPEGIEQIIDWHYQEHKIPAISAALILEENVYFINRGLKEKGDSLKVDQSTLYQIASLSKTFTGIILRGLVEEKRIDPEVSITPFLEEDLPQEVLARLEKIKIADLVFHTSGLPQRAENLKRKPLGGAVKEPYSKEQLLTDLAEADLQFEAGTGWAYTNLGYAFLGYILEQQTGQSYEELLQAYVIQPNELEKTSTALSPAERSLLATPYHPVFGTKTSDSSFGLHTAASGIYSSTEELAKLMQRQLAAYQNADSITFEPLWITEEVVGNGPVAYGYGIFKNTKDYRGQTHTYIAQGGDADGYVSQYGFLPEKKAGIILLSSSGGKWFWEMEQLILEKLMALN
ncbi:MAG: serine hydrolase domain-containing protein [Bacteroidota bacterium]